jgi:threonine dehydratase
MFQSLVNGKVTTIATAGLFGDGTSVRQVGEENYRVCASFVDDWVHVSTDEICAAIRDVYSESRTVLEPSGALAVAGCKKYIGANPELRGGVYCAVTSGANVLSLVLCVDEL